MLTLVGVTLSVLSAVPPAAAVLCQAPDTAEFLRLEDIWNEAHLRGDAEALDRLWADDLVVTVPGMNPMTKEESLEFARSGLMRFSRYETSDLRVRLHGDAAVVTGRVRRTRTLGNETVDDDWRFTKVYVRTGNTWRVIVFHTSSAS